MNVPLVEARPRGQLRLNLDSASTLSAGSVITVPCSRRNDLSPLDVVSLRPNGVDGRAEMMQSCPERPISHLSGGILLKEGALFDTSVLPLKQHTPNYLDALCLVKSKR